MRLTMTPNEAKALAGLAKAASSDDNRPILTGIGIEWNDDGLTAVATDSYVLAWRQWEPSRDNTSEVFHLDTEGEASGKVLIPAKPLATALADAQKVRVANYGKNLPDDMAPVELAWVTDAREVTVRVALAHDASMFLIHLRLIEGTFPNWRQLVGDFNGATEAAFDGARLRQVLEATGMTVGQMRGGIPFRFSIVDSLKPAHLRYSHQGEPDYQAVIMPVQM